MINKKYMKSMYEFDTNAEKNIMVNLTSSEKKMADFLRVQVNFL